MKKTYQSGYEGKFPSVARLIRKLERVLLQEPLNRKPCSVYIRMFRK